MHLVALEFGAFLGPVGHFVSLWGEHGQMQSFFLEVSHLKSFVPESMCSLIVDIITYLYNCINMPGKGGGYTG